MSVFLVEVDWRITEKKSNLCHFIPSQDKRIEEKSIRIFEYPLFEQLCVEAFRPRFA